MKRQQFSERGTTVVIIIAVWSKQLSKVYNTYGVAGALKYNDDGSDSRRRLRYYTDEYLIRWGIFGGDCMILATFDEEWEQSTPNFGRKGLIGYLTTPPHRRLMWRNYKRNDRERNTSTYQPEKTDWTISTSRGRYDGHYQDHVVLRYYLDKLNNLA